MSELVLIVLGVASLGVLFISRPSKSVEYEAQYQIRYGHVDRLKAIIIEPDATTLKLMSVIGSKGSPNE